MTLPLCASCGQPFKRASPRQLVCGPACREARLAALKAEQPVPPPARCACGRPLPRHAAAGRPRKTCNVCRAIASGALTHEDLTGFPMHRSKD